MLDVKLSSETGNDDRTDKFYLNFDIKEINYQEPAAVDSFYVESDQDLQTEFIFTDVTFLGDYRYPYIFHPDFPEDSIALMGSLRFVRSADSKFAEEFYDLDFITLESKSNLSALSDSTYRYASNELLFQKLQDENWGNKNAFGSRDISQLTMTLPFAGGSIPHWEQSRVTSNGFYWEHEQLSFTKIAYDKEDDSIWVQGEFEVELKELSCGFYSFYEVTNADFSALIR